MNCVVEGECDLISRDEYLGRVGIAQCSKCSIVYEVSDWAPRRCAECGLSWGESLHDPCLGTIEGATNVCCGHGDETKRYTAYLDGRIEGTPWR